MQISLVIPAYNEEAGIGDILAPLTEAPEFGHGMRIVVAANGCTDRTAEVARSYGVQVVEIATPSKAAALNAADAVLGAGPRVYLDADVPVEAALIRQLVATVDQPGVEAAVPRAWVDVSASSWPVRAYYAVNARLPVFERRLFGRGVIALSATARSRFDRFPELTADDMFLDAVVPADEKAELDMPVRVVAPRRVGDLIRRVARARAGNAEFWQFMRATPVGLGVLADPVPGPRVSSWLRNVLVPAPWLLPAAVVYVAVVLLAEARRRSPGWDVRSGWGRPTTVDAVRVPRPRPPADPAVGSAVGEPASGEPAAP